MPHLQIRDVFGSVFSISTTSRELLQAWFDEWLPVLYPADAPADLGDPLVMSVYPLDPKAEGYDWATDSRYLSDPFHIPRDPAQALAALDKRRAWIDAQHGQPRKADD